MRFFQRRRSAKSRPTHAQRRRLTLEPLETRNLMAMDLAAIGGTAFNDLTNNGLTADDTRLNGVTVELYRDTNGNNVFDLATDTLLGSTTTNASGVYRFASTNAGGTLAANTLTADDYFIRQLPTAGYSPPDPVLVTVTAANREGTTVQLIDTFDGTEQTVTASPLNLVASGFSANPNVIGGERDVVVTHLSGPQEVSVQINRFDSNSFDLTSNNFTVGMALIQYDGADNDPLALNAAGLSGVDLSDGNASAGLRMAARGDAVGATATVRVYTDAGNYSTVTITIPDQTVVDQLFVPFTAFTPGAGTGADFSSVGAIEVSIVGVAELQATVEVLSSQVPDELTVDLENLDPSVEIVKFTNGADANTATGPLLAVGATATFTYTVRSTGGTSLQNVVVTDDNGTPGNTSDNFSPTRTSGDTNSNNILETFETWTYTATRTVTAGQYSNTGTVNAEDLVGTQVTDNDVSNHFGVNALINVVKSTNSNDANTTPGPFLPVGSTATFTYVVTNPGNVALATVEIIDDNGTTGSTADDFIPTFQSGDANSNSQLDMEETWTYTATRTVTLGQYSNIVRVSGNPVDATGTDISGINEPTDTDPSNHFGATAGIDIVKRTNGQDANTVPGPTLGVGTTATFTYVVTNIGNSPLGTVVVRDDNGTTGNTADDFSPTLQSGDTNSNGRLDTDETWTYQATRTVTAGQYTNLGSVTANPVDTSGNDIAGMTDASDSDPSNHLGVAAGINIVKSTNGADANTATGPLLVVGSTATFTYVVTNTGQTDLGTVVVRDDNGTTGNTADDFSPTFQSGDTDSDGRLDMTETWTYTATRTVTLGQYSNIGSVTANPVDATGADISGMADAIDTDPSNHLGITTGINVVKSTNGQDANTAPGPNIAVGGTATFTYVVTPTGTVALGTVTIVDDNGTSSNTADDITPTLQSGDTNSNGRLDIAETWTYQATRTATAGQYTNTATVTGNPVTSDGTDIAGAANVTDTDVSNHFGFTTGMSLVKLTNGTDTGTGTGPSLSVGSIATFRYSVSNTGNVPLTTVVLTDNNGTPGTTADDFSPPRISGDTDNDNQLDVGETWIYQATRTVTLGAYTNTATVTADDPNQVDVTATDLSSHVGVNRLTKRRFLASTN